MMSEPVQLGLEPDKERQRRAAMDEPRAMRVPGSPQWCWQTVQHLKMLWEGEQVTLERLERTLSEIREHQAWNKIPEGRPYGSLETMLGDVLGANYKTRIQELEAIEPAKSPGAPKGNDNASVLKKQETQKDKVRDTEIVSKPRIPDSNRALAKLKAKAPDIAEAWARGEHKSVRAAGIAAGIVKPKTPMAQVESIAWRMSIEDLAAAVTLLTGIHAERCDGAKKPRRRK